MYELTRILNFFLLRVTNLTWKDGDCDESDLNGKNEESFVLLSLPWMRILDFIASDPEPLYTLKRRVREMTTLAGMHSVIKTDVLNYGLRKLCQHHVFPHFSKLKHETLTLPTIAQIRSMYLNRNDNDEMTKVEIVRLQLDDCADHYRAYLKLQCCVEDSRRVGKNKACRLYQVSEREFDLGRDPSQMGFSLVLLKDASFRKHGSTERMLQVRREYDESRTLHKETARFRKIQVDESIAECRARADEIIKSVIDDLAICKDKVPYSAIMIMQNVVIKYVFGKLVDMTNSAPSGNEINKKMYESDECASRESVLRELDAWTVGAHGRQRETKELLDFLVSSTGNIQSSASFYGTHPRLPFLNNLLRNIFHNL
jgi:hypothetical protein